MHILCTICSDLVNQAENIHVTKCGHIFHYNCLSEWMKRSKSCPQCRNKVTDRCMFRVYPTISNETCAEDVTTLQSRLDDAHLQLRTQKTASKEQEEKLIAATADLKKKEEILKALEKKQLSKDSTISALKEQLDYVIIQNKETQKLKEENEVLKKSMQTMQGLQKVLNATSEEVEAMIQGYSDIRTIATFATAFKRALCESESKKNDFRDRLHSAKQQLAAEKQCIKQLEIRVAQLVEQHSETRRKYECLKNKRKAELTFDSPVRVEPPRKLTKTRDTPPQDSSAFNDATLFNESNTSLNSMVRRIEDSDSPYLQLKQSSVALSVLQRPHVASNMKPSEFAFLNSSRGLKRSESENIQKRNKLSIFNKKVVPVKDIQSDQNQDFNLSGFNMSYDGLGGHSKLDVFPQPNTRAPLKSCIPKVTAKHKLKRPPTAGSQDIGKMLEKLRDK